MSPCIILLSFFPNSVTKFQGGPYRLYDVLSKKQTRK